MKIKNVEERTGLSRSNVRFYEKEKLIEPSRNESNGYRDYSENDVENIKKIAYLRTLGISIEDIRSIISGKVTLQETLERQNEILNSQITDLNKAKRMCEKMLGEESISYEKLQVEQYVTELQDYWKDNQTVFKLDSVSFLYIWGSMLTWITITVLCLIIGTLSYSKLPTEIPVQWSKGVATSLANKNWIFICPAQLSDFATRYEQLIYLNQELFSMIENSISLDLLARLLSTQLITKGEKHLLDRNRYYYKLLRRIIREGQDGGEFRTDLSVNEMVKLYAIAERALLYDWCICNGEYSLKTYGSTAMPIYLMMY